MDQKKLYKHWENIWENQRTDFRSGALNRLIAGCLACPGTSGKVLDVGCGACGMTLHMMRHGYDVTSIDTSPDMLSMGREYLARNGFPSERVIEATAEDFALDYPQAFDQLVCLDVIEHVQDDAQAVSSLLRLLKPGGRLVLTVPAMPSLYGPKDVELGHYRRYTVPSLSRLFAPHPCTIKEVRYWNLLGVPVTWSCAKIFRTKVNESVRYEAQSLHKKVLAQLLRSWFIHFENRIKSPFGLTLILVAEKDHVN